MGKERPIFVFVLTWLVALESSSAGYFVNVTESTATHTRTKLILSAYESYDMTHSMKTLDKIFLIEFSWASTIMLEQLKSR